MTRLSATFSIATALTVVACSSPPTSHSESEKQTQDSCNEPYAACLAKTAGVSEGTTWGDYEHLAGVCDAGLKKCLEDVAGN